MFGEICPLSSVLRELNASVVPQYAAYLAKNGIRGIFVNGTTGEGPLSLTTEERMEMAEAWMRQKHLIPTIIIQVAGCDLKSAQKLAAHAEKLGASGIGILPNMFNLPNDTDHLVQWIKHISGAAPNTPAVYYHIPICTKVTLPLPELLPKAAAQVPSFVGAKFTSKDCGEAGNCLRLKRPNGKPFLFFFGSDETYLGHYAFGIDSAIGSSFNFAPQLYHQINEAVGNNDVAKAKKLQKIVTEVYAALFKHGTPGINTGVSHQKVAMSLLTGIEMGPVRFPLLPMEQKHALQLAKDLKSLGIEKFHK